MYEAAKDAANVLYESGKIKEYEKILELLSKLLDLQNTVDELKKENANLKGKLKTKGKLELKNHSYWLAEDGPYCVRCWDKNKELIHMTPEYIGSNYSKCPECKNRVNVTGTRDDDSMTIYTYPPEEF